jgi:hypothetical protein
MIPPRPRRPIRLTPRILNRHTAPNPRLIHRDTIQPALITPALNPLVTEPPQRLARIPHRRVLPLQFEFALAPLLGLEDLPGAVDGPVAEGTETGEA